jgi:predicted TIM-barrel fold metal-dependent hydrolase
MEISVSQSFLGDERFRKMLLAHPADYLLFGTDSPWADQTQAIEALQKLNLPPDLLNKLLGQNAKRMLSGLL